MTINYVEPGDFVVDPFDGETREVLQVIDNQVLMADGGIMALAECTEVLLPSEVLG